MKKPGNRAFAAPLLIGLFSPLAGCASTLVPEEGIGLEWVRVTEAQAALLAILYEGKSTATTSEQAAEHCADLVRMKVGACVEATVTGASVRYAFTGCKDLPYGLTAVSGVVAATYEAEVSNNLTHAVMTVEGSGISLDGATLDLKALVSAVPSGMLPPDQAAGPHASSLNVSTTSAGTTKEGHRFTFEDIESTRPGIVSVYADTDRCVDFDTTSPSLEQASGTIENQGVQWAVTVEGFRRCGESCPMPGAFVAVSDVIDGALGNETPRFLRFDGTATAKLFDYFASQEDKDAPDPVPFQLGCTPAKQ